MSCGLPRTARSPVPPQYRLARLEHLGDALLGLSYSTIILGLSVIQKASLSFMMNDVHVHGATQEDQCLGHVSSLEAESPLC